MDQQKIVAWGIVLFGAFLLYQIVGIVRNQFFVSESKKRKKKPRQKPSFSLSTLVPKKKPPRKQRMIQYELVVQLTSGDVVTESFSDTEQLTRNEALAQHFEVVNQHLRVDGNDIPLAHIQSIQLTEAPSVSLFDIPDQTEAVSVFDVPEEPVRATPRQSAASSVSVSSVSAPLVSDSNEFEFDPSWMKTTRQMLGLTQKVVGQQTGIPDKRVSKIERGFVRPTEEEITALRQALSITVEVPASALPPDPEPDLVSIQKEGVSSEIQDDLDEVKYVLPLEELDTLSPREQKRAKKQTKIPESSRSLSKVARVGVWALIVGLGCSGWLAFGTAASANLKSANAQAAVQQVQTALENPQTEIDDTTQVMTYFSEFLPVFLNNDPQNSEARTVREAALKHYFSDVSVVATSTQYKQQLISYELYNIETETNRRVAQYLVRFTVEGKTDDPEKVTELTQLINIPFISDKGILAIAELPYYTPAPVDKGVTTLEGNSLSQEAEVAADVGTPIKEFAEQFFTNYATNSLEDMQYMMTQPESLEGLYTYVSSENRVYPTSEGRYIVKSTVTFALKETEFTHKENMTLVIGKQDDKFFVEELSHTLGG